MTLSMLKREVSDPEKKADNMTKNIKNQNHIASFSHAFLKWSKPPSGNSISSRKTPDPGALRLFFWQIWYF